MRVGATVLLLAAAVAAAPSARSLDKASARRLARLGDKALKDGQGATARRIFERALELDPGHVVARLRLGHERDGKEWTAPETSPLGQDKQPYKARGFLRDLRKEEKRRVEAYLRAGLVEEYPKLLARMPRHAGLHKALGHERIGRRYARPELAAAARRFDKQRKRWQQFATPAELRLTTAEVPGVGRRPAYRTGNKLMGGTIPDADLQRVAGTLHATDAFLRDLFGEDVPLWDRPALLLVTREDYARVVKATLPPGNEREIRLRWAFVRTAAFAAWMVSGWEDARDVHAHSVASYSAARWVAPRTPSGPDWRAYAWFNEGLGFFAHLALFQTGHTAFSSLTETSRKIPPSVPPPERRDRASLLAWLQGEIVAGTTEPLRDVAGRLLNSLDLLMSLQMWSFLEFLAAYDPDGLRTLPEALRAQADDSYADRSDRALHASFGKGFAGLEPLWRAFVLEIM